MSAPAIDDNLPEAPCPTLGGLVPGDMLGNLRILRVLDDRTAFATRPDLPRGAVLVHWPEATADDLRALRPPPHAPAHPHWLPIVDTVPHDSGLVLVHPATGPSLQTFRRCVQLTLLQIDALGRQLIAAVEAAHRQERVVGALDPRRIWLSRTPHVVTPFVGGVGLSDVLPDPARYVVGTAPPAFVAPEVLEGGPLSVAADRFALGAVLFSLVTGRPPDPARFVPPVLAAMPERIRMTVEQCLAPDPVARPLDVLAAWTRGRVMPTGAWGLADLQHLDRLSPQAPAPTAEEPAAVRASPAVSRLRAPLVATVALVGATTGLLWWWGS